MTQNSDNFSYSTETEFFSEQDQFVKSSRIMMVDDEPINMEVLQLHLESEGYRNFLSTSNSSEAFEIIKREKPDIVLLDLMMPDVTGFDILQQIRSSAEVKHLSVIVLTSSNDPETKLRALRMGANDFLSKPVDASELALRLRNTLAAQTYQTQLSHHDPVTGLPNKKKLVSDFADVIKRYSTKGTSSGLMLIGVDRLKPINDSLGRQIGDEVLHAVAQRMQMSFSRVEIPSGQAAGERLSCIFRVGGDKFAVVLPAVQNNRQLSALLRLFLNKMAEPLIVGGNELLVHCSIGTALFEPTDFDRESLLGKCETAMLEAKQQSGSSYSHYTQDMDENARRLMLIENGLRHAEGNKEFYLVFQPKVSVASGEIVGAEALIRWEHPTLGLISPDQFIPMAEDSGSIVPIGTWVLNEACIRMRQFQDAGFDELKVAVNVSIRQLHEDDFISIVVQALDAVKLSPKCLKLELTENMIMDNAPNNVAKLHQLRNMGVEVSIDDFGTGYSSLSYLQKFPLDELKIDQYFIRAIQSPLDPAPIVKAVISLGHDLGMSLVAEGVETHHQLARLKALKCDEFQGFLCSKPVVADLFLELLKESRLDKAA